MATRRKHVTTLVGPSKTTTCPNPYCGALIAWVLYVPVAHRMKRGTERKHLALDLPALAAGDEWPSVEDLRRVGVSHVSTRSLLQCELLDDDRGLLAHEYGHSLHLVTHPECLPYLTRRGETR